MADLRTAATSGDEPKKRPAPQKRPAPAVPGTSAFKGGFTEFLRDAWIEVSKKTTWPTRAELIRSTSVVLAAIIAVSIYLALIDLGMTEITKKVLYSR